MAKKEKAEKKKRLTKSQIIANIAEGGELDKKSVTKVFDGLTEVIRKELGKRGPGEFVIPGLLKLRVRQKDAVKEHQRPDPFNPGKMMTVKAKPASRTVRAAALKALKDMIQ
jgi:DNA-binding protein HU-beta